MSHPIKRALLISAYDAQSHARWHRGLTQTFAAQWQWSTITLPPRHFAWRARSNPLSLLQQHRELLSAPWDLFVATSMTELATLKGLCPSLAHTPTLVYFHENQLAYPTTQAKDPNLLHLQLGNLYTAMAAEVIAYNSAYNRDTMLQGLRALIRKMPEGAALLPHLDDLEARSVILPVPLEDDLIAQRPLRREAGPLKIAWNHRWEHDKAPDRFFDALHRLSASGHDFELRILGQQFRHSPPCFAQAKETLAKHITHFGYAPDKATYHELLRTSDVIVSTALHDFQGLAMQEAIALGCRPLAPNRLAYPEYIKPQDLYESTPADADAEAATLARRLAQCIQAQEHVSSYAQRREQWTWSAHKQAYQDAFALAITRKLTPSPEPIP